MSSSRHAENIERLRIVEIQVMSGDFEIARGIRSIGVIKAASPRLAHARSPVINYGAVSEVAAWREARGIISVW